MRPRRARRCRAPRRRRRCRARPPRAVWSTRALPPPGARVRSARGPRASRPRRRGDSNMTLGSGAAQAAARKRSAFARRARHPARKRIALGCQARGDERGLHRAGPGKHRHRAARRPALAPRADGPDRRSAACPSRRRAPPPRRRAHAPPAARRRAARAAHRTRRARAPASRRARGPRGAGSRTRSRSRPQRVERPQRDVAQVAERRGYDREHPSTIGRPAPPARSLPFGVWPRLAGSDPRWPRLAPSVIQAAPNRVWSCGSRDRYDERTVALGTSDLCECDGQIWHG